MSHLALDTLIRNVVFILREAFPLLQLSLQELIYRLQFILFSKIKI